MELDLSKYFLPYQIRHILCPATARLEEKSRRIGITYANSYKHCRRRNLIDYARHLYFSSADDSSAYEYAQYCRQWCELLEASVKEILQELSDKDGFKYNNYIVEFPNGSRVNCMSSNPKRFRSKGGDIVLDEFAFHENPEDMFDAASPCILWGYTIELLSTHNGMNTEFLRFINGVLKVQRGETTFEKLGIPEFVHQKTTIIDAVEQGLAEKVYKLDHIDPAAREKFLKFCRSLCRSEDQWKQEFLCIPADEESTLIAYGLYNKCADANCLTGRGDGQCYMGYDIGRYHDRSIFWVAELVGDVLVTREIVNLKNVDYPTQEEIGRNLMEKYNIARMCGDFTGKGDAIIEYLQRRFGEYRVEKVTFTNPAKDRMAGMVLAKMEDRKCRLPDDIQIREAFHQIKQTLTANGHPRYDAVRTDAGHGDEFWAFALCCEAANVPAIQPSIINLSGGDEFDDEAA